jgi:hypothetical protein
MRIMDAIALSGFARRTAESATDFAGVVRNLIMDVRDSYRPGLYHTRGPGPKWRAKHQPWLKFGSQAVRPAGLHQLSPRCGRRRDAGVAAGLAVLAIAQMGVHLVFFLHITTGPDSSHNVLALAFGVLIVFLVLAGSLVINENMTAHTELMNLQMQR